MRGESYLIDAPVGKGIENIFVDDNRTLYFTVIGIKGEEYEVLPLYEKIKPITSFYSREDFKDLEKISKRDKNGLIPMNIDYDK
jgi:hypothetical protein